MLLTTEAITLKSFVGKCCNKTISKDMKNHDFDCLYVFDTNDLSIKNRNYTEMYERIFYAGSERAFNYYDGAF